MPSMQYYSSSSQTVLPDLIMLPQRGAFSGPSGRPPNSYAILLDDCSILFDAVYSWNVPGIAELQKQGKPPRLLVLSHWHVVMNADAIEEITERFGCRLLMHPDDAKHRHADPYGAFSHPVNAPELQEARVDAIHVPGHTDGAMMLYWNCQGGVFLTGDNAVGPGPQQMDLTPHLSRPIMRDSDHDDMFRVGWRNALEGRAVRSVLPHHGDWYVDRDDMMDILGNVWDGEPVDFSDS